MPCRRLSGRGRIELQRGAGPRQGAGAAHPAHGSPSETERTLLQGGESVDVLEPAVQDRHARIPMEGGAPVKVLIVDDDPASRRHTSMALEEYGIEYGSVPCPTLVRGALASSDDSPYDVVLLDVELPATKGWDLLTELRQAGAAIPVIFVSVRESIEDCVRGLNLGADDYIVKPFESSE